jgi:hypothetical protein
MPRTGTATLPLHHGKAPRWLFSRMTLLAREIITALSSEFSPNEILKRLSDNNLNLTERHNVTLSDINPKRIYSVLLKTYERQPENFEKLLGMRRVGPKTIRALSLVSELIYGAAPSYRDPARFSFAHGGKDGTPFPVDRKTYDKTVSIMKKAIEASKIGHKEKLKTIRRLSRFYEI